MRVSVGFWGPLAAAAAWGSAAAGGQVRALDPVLTKVSLLAEQLERRARLVHASGCLSERSLVALWEGSWLGGAGDGEGWLLGKLKTCL